MRTEIIWEDKDALVVYKPAGLAVQTARIGQPDVVSELKNYLAAGSRSAEREPGRGTRGRATRGTAGAAEPYLGVIHRLDQPVEGLLVFAKNREAAAALTRQLQSQGAGENLNKQYLCVLCGYPALEEGVLVNEMYKDASGRAVVLDASAKAKRAVLHFRILEKQDGICLAKVCIETGRFHQIRAQMAYAGTPLLGDRKYGNEDSEIFSEKFQVKNVALCADKLEFFHPSTGEKLSYQVTPRGTIFTRFQSCRFM